jgi:hypothetical protein
MLTFIILYFNKKNIIFVYELIRVLKWGNSATIWSFSNVSNIFLLSFLYFNYISLNLNSRLSQLNILIATLIEKEQKKSRSIFFLIIKQQLNIKAGLMISLKIIILLTKLKRETQTFLFLYLFFYPIYCIYTFYQFFLL